MLIHDSFVARVEGVRKFVICSAEHI